MTQEETVLYFGYGSNLDAKDWNEWCERTGRDPSGITELEPCWLPDHRLKFHYHSRLREGGAADVEPAGCGHAVPGVLFSLNSNALANMDKKEGHPNIYRRTNVTVIKGDGTSVEAITYRVQPDRIGDHVAPTSHYVGLIESNLIRNNLPIVDLKNAIENNEKSYPVDHLFVYGTLMSGEFRGTTLEQFSISEGVKARAEGALYHLGDYPGMRPAKNERVIGELHRLDDVFTALQSLDRVEGFYGFTSPDSLYNRTLIQVEVEQKMIWAWTYFYASEPPAGSKINSGDWRTL